MLVVARWVTKTPIGEEANIQTAKILGRQKYWNGEGQWRLGERRSPVDAPPPLPCSQAKSCCHERGATLQ